MEVYTQDTWGSTDISDPDDNCNGPQNTGSTRTPDTDNSLRRLQMTTSDGSSTWTSKNEWIKYSCVCSTFKSFVTSNKGVCNKTTKFTTPRNLFTCYLGQKLHSSSIFKYPYKNSEAKQWFINPCNIYYKNTDILKTCHKAENTNAAKSWMVSYVLLPYKEWTAHNTGN